MIRKCFLEKDPQLQIEPEDFSEEADSTILVRERVKDTKLEGNFKKVKGQIVSQSGKTISVLPKSGKQTIYSKRDVAKLGQDASSNKKEDKNTRKAIKANTTILTGIDKQLRNGTTPKMPEREQQTEEETTPRQIEREENQDQTVQIKKSKSETGEGTEKEEKEELRTEPKKKKERRYP